MTSPSLWSAFLPMLQSAAIAAAATLGAVLYAVAYLRWVKGRT